MGRSFDAVKRDYLRDRLSLLEPDEIKRFNKYAGGGVEAIPEEYLEAALGLVERTLERKEKQSVTTSAG